MQQLSEVNYQVMSGVTLSVPSTLMWTNGEVLFGRQCVTGEGRSPGAFGVCTLFLIRETLLFLKAEQ